MCGEARSLPCPGVSPFPGAVAVGCSGQGRSWHHRAGWAVWPGHRVILDPLMALSAGRGTDQSRSTTVSPSEMLRAVIAFRASWFLCWCGRQLIPARRWD